MCFGCLDKIALQKNNIIISQPKYMLRVLKTSVKIMGDKIQYIYIFTLKTVFIVYQSPLILNALSHVA